MQTNTTILLNEHDDQWLHNHVIQIDASCRDAAVFFIIWCYLRRYWEYGIETFTREPEYQELCNTIEEDYLRYVDDYPTLFNPFGLYDKDELKHILKEELTEILSFIAFIKKSEFVLQSSINRRLVSSDDIMLLTIAKLNRQICVPIPTKELSTSDCHPSA